MEKYEKYKKAIGWMLENDGAAWVELGKANDGTALCLVLGWQDGYDVENDNHQKTESGELYTLCGKLAYNCDYLRCSYDFDWNMPYAENGDVYDTSMAISKQNAEKDFAWWLAESKNVIAMMNSGELKYE